MRIFTSVTRVHVAVRSYFVVLHHRHIGDRKVYETLKLNK